MSKMATAPDPVKWNRSLLWLAVAMVPLILGAFLGILFDPRTLSGVSVWTKPLKFGLSTAAYSVTFSWLIGQTVRWRRASQLAGTITAGLLALELVVIFGFASIAETSHFNVSTPLHTIAWSTMAFSIVGVWVLTLVVAISLIASPIGNAARTLAIRAGVLISLVGMALAFLMTGPTAQQLDDFQGIAGAHTVGADDGGPGVWLFGWSTIAGDLRIPHFVGMHAIQVFVLLVLALELIGRRSSRLHNVGVRLSLIRIAVVGYSLALAVVTWQALAGQSIVAPTRPILFTGLVVIVATVAAAIVVIVRGNDADGPGPASAER